MNFCILPAGAWGTAVAIHLDALGENVTLVPREESQAERMRETRENEEFLAGYPLGETMTVTHEYQPALGEADVCIIAAPTKFLRNVCREIRESLAQNSSGKLKLILTLTKGVEEGTQQFPYEVIQEELPGYAVGTLSGPTFASQVAGHQPSAIVLASTLEGGEAEEIQKAMSGPALRVYRSSDLKGVSLGGSLKNVYAIASGCCDGLGLTDNAKAALLTRSLAEMHRIGTALGGETATFYGLSGMGDLVLTCNGQESRNRTFGELIATGVTIDELINERKMTVEGYKTCLGYHKLCQEKGIDAPIIEQIYETLYNGVSPKDGIERLMTRDLKAESL
ncbi:NAD(P)H-dependent glycerol-3-phosphate dehydrogenase [Pelagicoccus mobilis]|uniref:Glycerol-3-phosphate dehydrogenase [NAD(P)+] n=1 Tax=Pelagicoccus mobilis TaxID=415221 RepID=A0A934VPB3_9BACT|nr:NAD(P)H-dependent glycerol-3-phosphate dehydrogenase [Pelagicoccus mobilis]MBK1875359.1 NAD(P)-dependent glycerol-3-phosphate dehydrogenase [Pelagicoccus mobilis]